MPAEAAVGLNICNINIFPSRRSRMCGVGSNLTRTVKWLILLCLVIDITITAEWSIVDPTEIHTNKHLKW